MDWRLPQLERKSLPGFPAWWVWLLLPLACVLAAAVVLFFTWPVARGFTDRRFWFWLLLIPLLTSVALELFLLSHVLHQRREIRWRHLFIDSKQAQWRQWGRQSLTLAGWHVLTPEPDLALRVLGLEGVVPQAPAKAVLLPRPPQSELGMSPLRDILTQTLTPLLAVLRPQPVVDIWLYTGSVEDESRQALAQCWLALLSRQLPDNRIHWQAEPPDARLLYQWCDEPSDTPRLLLCTQLLSADAAGSEFSVALLFTAARQRLPENTGFRPVSVFRPLFAPATEPEEALTDLLSVEQMVKGQRRHLWDTGLDTRARNTVLAVLDAQGETLPSDGQHLLARHIGEPDKNSFWLALGLAAQATDTGQRGQMVVAPLPEQTACVQLNVHPAPATPWPQDNVSRYPLVWTAGVCCVLLLFFLLMDSTVQQMLWPWLAGGGVLYALLMLAAVPLALILWQRRLNDEWQLQGGIRHE